jgi:hypothetical protein
VPFTEQVMPACFVSCTKKNHPPHGEIAVEGDGADSDGEEEPLEEEVEDIAGEEEAARGN